jgi:ribosomal protein S21
MIEIKVDGSLERALKKLKFLCQQTGVFSEIKKHSERVPPGVRRRLKERKSLARCRRRMRKIERFQQY